MSIFVAHDEATPLLEETERGTARHLAYFGLTSPHAFGPVAFLVDYGDSRATRAHFHSVDQFQVFFGGNGATYQRHPLPGVELHYSDAFTTYGPFAAGSEGLRFFTLRMVPDEVKGYMPDDRDKLPYVGRRNIHVDLDERLAAPHPEAGATEAEELLGSHDDGLGAELVALGPSATIMLAPRHPATSGGYVCVLRGEVVVDGRPFGARSLAWFGDGETVPLVTGSSSGASVLRLSFPSPATPEVRGSGSSR